MKKAIFAGSFDPIHKGHIKIIEKAAKLFDEVHIVVANNEFKNGQKNIDQRVEYVNSQIDIKNVVVEKSENEFIANYALRNNINYLIRSARDDVDFEYELEMAKVNSQINSKIETVLIIPDYEDIELRSSKFRDYDIDKQSKLFKK